MRYIKVIKETEMNAQDIRDMVWSGARDHVDNLSDDQLEVIIDNLLDAYPEGIDETELNDFLWFEDNTYAQWLGYPDAELLWYESPEDDDYEDEYDESEDYE